MTKTARKTNAGTATLTDTTATAPTALTLDTAVLEYGGFKLPAKDLLVATSLYLLQYGFAKSMQDSVAGFKAKRAKELTEAALAQDPDQEVDEEEIAAKVEAEANALMAERFAKIQAGTVGTRAGGPRLRGLEALQRDVAVEMATAKGVKFPAKVSDPIVVGGKSYQNRAAFIQALLAGKMGDAIRTEAQRRHEAAPEADLEDLI